MSIGLSPHLPTVYAITGLSIAEGLIFLTQCSAEQWLTVHAVPLSAVAIVPAKVVYYASKCVEIKTTEDLIRERDAT